VSPGGLVEELFRAAGESHQREHSLTNGRVGNGMKPPETPEDYWSNVDEAWDSLLSIIAHHMDLNSPAYDPPGNLEGKMTGRTLLEELVHLKRTRDRERLPRYFHAAWGWASDAYAWSVPHWGTLCDLCSEEWCLYTEEERSKC